MSVDCEMKLFSAAMVRVDNISRKVAIFLWFASMRLSVKRYPMNSHEDTTKEHFAGMNFISYLFKIRRIFELWDVVYQFR